MNTKLKRITAIVAVIAILATMAVGAFAYFTDYASDNLDGKAGTLEIELTDATEDLTNGLSIMNPGDSNELKFTVNNVGEKSATVRAVMTISVLDKDGNPIELSENDPQYKITDLDGKELKGEFATSVADNTAANEVMLMAVAEPVNNVIVYTADDVTLNGSIETEPGVTETSHTYNYKFVMDMDAGNAWQGSEATVKIEIFAKQDRNTENVGDNWTDMVEGAGSNEADPDEPTPDEPTPDEPTPGSYKIIYVSNGGTLPTDAADKYTEETPATLPTPTKDGSTFAGWYENEDLSGDPVTSTAGSTGDKTYYAKWETINYQDFVVTKSNRAKVGYTGEAGENLVIPATFYDESKNTWYKVVGIGQYAFDGSTDLNSVVIPNTVTSIEYGAFYDATGLTSVNIPNSVTSMGECAFRGCSSLTSIAIPGSLSSVPKMAFYKCSGLTNATISEGVTSVGESAFENCFALSSLTLPNGLTTIGKSAFDSCVALTSVNFPSSLTSIGDYAFECCEGLTSVTIPDSVTSIGKRVFAQCYNIATATIPKDITSISDYCFYLCRSLTSINVPDTVTYIGACAFQGCKIDIEIPAGVTHIGANAFCSTLMSGDIVLPEGITSIGAGTFQTCRQLTSVVIPEGVTSIGEKAFYQCYNMTSVNIPSTVTSIGVDAFRDSKLTSITIPGSVNSIEEGTFFQCNYLTSVTLEEGVTSIGVEAFWNCGRITSVTIPSTVTSIGTDAFDMTTVTNLYYGGTEEQWGQIAIADGNANLTKGTVHYGS